MLLMEHLGRFMHSWKGNSICLNLDKYRLARKGGFAQKVRVQKRDMLAELSSTAYSRLKATSVQGAISRPSTQNVQVTGPETLSRR
jgi:hypothetical protein